MTPESDIMLLCIQVLSSSAHNCGCVVDGIDVMKRFEYYYILLFIYYDLSV